jgi:sulfate transport system substrate-binding protein
MKSLGMTLFAALGLAGMVGCGAKPAAPTATLKLGAYSVVKEAFHDGLLPAFAAEWKARTGADVRFEESYNASGAQARAIASGFDADIAVLSHEGDMDALVKADRVDKRWRSGPHGGVLTHSVVAIAHREGNPKQITGWADLARPGIGVLYADPKTSGGARWNINAIYGAAKLAAEAHGTEAAVEIARDRLGQVQANVVNMDSSGRLSMANFAERGIGDAVITYENELLLRAKQGKPIPFFVPDSTLLIESPIALVESSISRHGNREVAEAFLQFAHSERGQKILAEYGFRPVDPRVAETLNLPKPPGLFTMADLGGWERIQEELYGPRGHWTLAAELQSRKR